MTRRPAAGALRRTLLHTPRAGALLAVVAFLAALLVTATPRVLDQVGDDVLAHRLGTLTPTTSALVAEVVGRPTGDDAMGGLLADLGQVRARAGEPVRDLLGEPQARVVGTDMALDQVPEHDVRYPTLRLAHAPALPEHVDLAEGRWPDAAVTAAERAAGAPVEVVLSQTGAQRLAWQVGTDREAAELRVWGLPTAVRLVGTYVARDPASTFWAHATASAAPQVVEDLDAGTTVLAAGYTSPEVALGLAQRTEVWLDLAGAADLRIAEAELAAGQLRGLTAAGQPAGGLTVRLATGALEPIESAVADVATLRVVGGFVLAGPLAALGAALVVASRLVLQRRAQVLDVMRARGASGWQRRSLMALHGLVLALPGGALGVAAGVALTPDAAALPLAAPVLTTLAVPAVLAGSVGGRPDGRLRLVLELAALALAALATFLVLQRGLRDDPLLLATPALLALAVGIVTTRVAPVPLRGVLALARRRTDAAPVLGAAGAARETTLAPLLGMSVGVGVAILAVSLLASVRAGIEEQSWFATGADLRVSGPVMSPEALDAVGDVPGVAALAAVSEVNPAQVASPTAQVQARAVLVDGEALAQVQSGFDGWSVPASLGRSDGPVAAVLAQGLERTTGAGTLRLVVDGGEVDVEVADVVAAVPGVTRTTNFVVVDRDRLVEATGVAEAPRVLLVDLDDDLSATARHAVTAGVLAATGAVAHDLRQDVVERRLADPTVDGLRTLLLVSLATGVLGAVVTVAAAQVVAAARTERTLTVLAVLGGRRGDAWRVAAWELVGPAALGLVAGGALGVGLATLATRAIDLGGFVGGSGATAPALGGGTGAVVVGFVLAVVASVAVSGVRASRVDVTAMLREEQ